MKVIRVVAAVIKAANEQGKPMIFATQRGYGDLKGGWECIFRKNRALAPHERSAVPLGTDHCPVG